MDSCEVFLQCSSMLWRIESLFHFCTVSWVPFLSFFTWQHSQFAPHSCGLGATLRVYIQDQGTRKRIKRMDVSALGALFYIVRKLCAIKPHQMHDATYFVVSISEGTEWSSHPAAPSATWFCWQKLSWTTLPQITIPISILWPLYWNI